MNICFGSTVQLIVTLSIVTLFITFSNASIDLEVPSSTLQQRDIPISHEDIVHLRGFASSPRGGRLIEAAAVVGEEAPAHHRFPLDVQENWYHHRPSPSPHYHHRPSPSPCPDKTSVPKRHPPPPTTTPCPEKTGVIKKPHPSPSPTPHRVWPVEMDKREVEQPVIVFAPSGENTNTSGDLDAITEEDRAQCPDSRRSCRAAFGGFECIDMDELTSCGGCVSEGTGQDCTAIEGARIFSCISGRCAVDACNEGYRYTFFGTCVKST